MIAPDVTPDTYTPRHSWPYECAGERCAQHAIAHRPKHRAISETIAAAGVEAWETWNEHNCGHCGRASATQADWDALPEDDPNDDDFGMCWAKVADADCCWSFNDIDPRKRAIGYVLTAVAPLIVANGAA